MTKQVSSPTMLPAVSPEPSANYFPRHDNTPQPTSQHLSAPTPPTSPTTVRSEPTVPPQPPTIQQPPALSHPLLPQLALTPTVAPSVTPPSHPVVSTQGHEFEPTVAPLMTQPHPVHSTPMLSGNDAPMPSGYGIGAPMNIGSGHHGTSTHPGIGSNGAPMHPGSGCTGAPTLYCMHPTYYSQGPPMHFNNGACLPPGNGMPMPAGSYYSPMHPNSTPGYMAAPAPYSLHPTLYSHGQPMHFNNGAYLGAPAPCSVRLSHYSQGPPNNGAHLPPGNGMAHSYGLREWNTPHNPSMQGHPLFAVPQPPVHPAPWSDSYHPNSGGLNSSPHNNIVYASTPSDAHTSTVLPNARPSSPVRAGAPSFTPTSPTAAPLTQVPERAQKEIRYLGAPEKGIRYLSAPEIAEVLDAQGYPSYLIRTVTAPAYITNPDARDLTYHVGGKPTPNFNGLEPSTYPSPATKKRSVIGGAEDSTTTAGTESKLTRDTDFPKWLDKFTAQCQKYGLDTCLYLNPRNRGMQLISRCLPLCDKVIMAAIGEGRRGHMRTNGLYLNEEHLIHAKLVNSISDARLLDLYQRKANLVDELPTTPVIEVLYHLFIHCTGGPEPYINGLMTKFDRLQVSSSTSGLVGALSEFTTLLQRMEDYNHYPLVAIDRLFALARSAPPYAGFSLKVASIEEYYKNIVPSTFKYESFFEQVAFLKKQVLHPIQLAEALSESYRTYSGNGDNRRATSHAEQAHYTSASSDTPSAALAKARADHQENIQRGKESKRRLDALEQNQSVSTNNTNNTNNNNRNNNNRNNNNNNRNNNNNNNRNDRGNGSSPSRRNSSSHSRGNREGRDRHGNSSSPRRNRHRSPSSQSPDNSTAQTNSSNNQNKGSTPAPTLTANYVIEPPSEDEDYMPMVYLAASIPRPEAPSTPPMVRVSIPPVIDTSLLAPIPESDNIPFVFDTGATDNIVPDATAFLPGTLRPLATAVSVLGLTSRAPVAGKGTIAVDFPAIDGSSRRLEMDAYYIPDPTIPYIISPQSYLAQQKARNNNEWPEQFTVTSDDACCFVHHPKAPDFWIPKTSSGLFVGYGTLASASASTTPSIAPKLLTKGSRAASDHNLFTGRQPAMHSLATEATRPSGTQRAPTLPQREPTLPQREPSSPQREPSSPQREPSSPQREPYPFQGEITESEHVDTAHESSPALAPYNEYCLYLPHGLHSIAQDPTPYTTSTNLDIYDNDVTLPVLGPTLSKRGSMNFVPSPSDGSFHVSIDRRWDPSIDERECQDIYINDIYPALSIV